MSPRSEEFASEARRRLVAARHSIDAGDFGVAVGVAYYAMLYAARAALSERDLNAKTHGGTWSLFADHLVRTAVVDSGIAAKARDAERLRYEVDYDASDADREVAEALLTDAERFVDAVLRTLG
ncbi:MAG: HEPN domain-containing protein [Solirubrobacterales bacterium]